MFILVLVILWKEMKRCTTYCLHVTIYTTRHALVSNIIFLSFSYLYIHRYISIHNPNYKSPSQRIHTIQRYISNIIYSSSTMMKNASLPYLQTLKMSYAITWSLQPNHSSDGKYVQRVHSQHLNLCVNWHFVPILELLRI